MPKFFLQFITGLVTLSLLVHPVFAAHNQSSTLGNDISYPQCGKLYPKNPQFGVVGINGGIATTTNPCLSSELSWANNSLGGVSQAKIQVYVNTADPGGLNTASWPSNNTDPSGYVTTNPYGTCDGSNSLACSWQYGWNRIVDDVQSRLVPAAQAAKLSTSPSSYPWWLDVETANTWESGSTLALQENAADLEGMVASLQFKGATVGLYSTSSQWNQIVGSLSSTSSLNGLNSWLPGATSSSGAKANCSLPSLTSGGKVTITQYTTTYDYDYSCI